MSRTTEELVKKVLAKDYDSKKQHDLTPYMEWAASVTDDYAACATSRGSPQGAAKLELIERWLSAHAYVCMDQTYSRKKTGDADASYHGQTGMHLNSSRYGQCALTLDPTGCLLALSSGKKRRVLWVGKTETEQLTYDERN